MVYGNNLFMMSPEKYVLSTDVTWGSLDKDVMMKIEETVFRVS